MSSDPLPPPQNWDPLTEDERRVLGVLVEKQKTSKTADSYPLTLNALTTGCNQKSNRDPVLDLTEDEVEETLTALQRKGLVMRQTGGRVERFKHLLYEKWTGDGPQLAVLAELLLRGPQTKGELRGRASRMAPIDTLDDLEGVLRPLAARRLVVYLTDPDRRGAVLTHGFHTPDELARARAAAGARADADDRAAPAAPAGERGPPAPQDAALEARLAAVEAELAELKAVVADLRRPLGG
jgi:uncharacterized protein YceH (UPF0502 family)